MSESTFTSELEIRYIDGDCWLLTKDFAYDVGYLGSGWQIRVPAGFSTDGASVPRIFWALISQWEKHGKAAVLHDYLYNETNHSRLICDAVFLEAMLVLKVNRLKASIIFLAVRLFGGKEYQKTNAD